MNDEADEINIDEKVCLNENEVAEEDLNASAISTAAEESNTEFKCHDCGQLFRDIEQLSAHALVHELNLKCNQSGVSINPNIKKRIKCKKKISIHQIQRVQKRLICEMCNEVFFGKYNLKRHKCNKLRKILYKCGKCGKAFKLKSSLKVHDLVHHKSSFACSKCDKKFSSEVNLKEHLKMHNRADGSVTIRNENSSKIQIANHTTDTNQYIVNTRNSTDIHSLSMLYIYDILRQARKKTRKVKRRLCGAWLSID